MNTYIHKYYIYIYIHTYIDIYAYCRFSYDGNWELVKSILETKFRRSHVCLHPQGSCLATFVDFYTFSKLQRHVSAFLCYAIILSVQKLTQVVKPNTTGFLRIQIYNRKILKRILAKGD